MVKKLLTLLFASVLAFPAVNSVRAGGWCSGQGREGGAVGGRYHKKQSVNDIDASQVKDNDRVICKGTYDKDGVLHATLMSKRLSRP
jgi:hypothetical protein